MNSFREVMKNHYPDFTDGETFEINYDAGLKLVKKLLTKFLKHMHNKDLAQQIKSMLNSADYLGLLKLSLDPRDYSCGEDFADDYQALSMLKKCRDLPGLSDELREFNALKTSADAEAQCRRTNIIWNSMRPTPLVEEILLTAQSIIENILGPLDLEYIYEHAAYGPGSSSSCHGDSVSLPGKLCATMDVSSEALPYAQELLARRPEFNSSAKDILTERLFVPVGPLNMLEPTYNIVNHDTYICVDKSALTDRGICIAQHLNIVLQKGGGSLMRNRLRKHKIGYNLDSQSTVNREMARIGSITSKIATIDVKTASDTIAYKPVEFLLPPDWFQFCDALRATHTLYPCGTLHENHKFSSMGNGFTFELESLLFFTLAYATCKVLKIDTKDELGQQVVYSFGDDIICPSACVDTLTKVLAYCGFTLNIEKSFTGLEKFRESCGSDYWDGGNVRPFYIREVPRNETDLIKLANAIKHYAFRRGSGCYFDIRLLPLWRSVTDVLRENHTHRIPIGPRELGDIVLWASVEEYGDQSGVVVPFHWNGIRYFGSIRGKRRTGPKIIGSKFITASSLINKSVQFICPESYFLRCSVELDEQTTPRVSTPLTRTIRGSDEKHLRRSYTAFDEVCVTLCWI